MLCVLPVQNPWVSQPATLALILGSDRASGANANAARAVRSGNGNGNGNGNGTQ